MILEHWKKNTNFLLLNMHETRDVWGYIESRFMGVNEMVSRCSLVNVEQRREINSYAKRNSLNSFRIKTLVWKKNFVIKHISFLKKKTWNILCMGETKTKWKGLKARSRDKRNSTVILNPTHRSLQFSPDSLFFLFCSSNYANLVVHSNWQSSSLS